MEKKLIEVSIINGEEKEIYEVTAEKHNDKYRYIENNDFNTKVTYNFKKKILRRENDQLFMEFNFNTKEALILLKENDKEMVLPIEVVSISDNLVNYKLENQDFKYEIKEK